MNVTTPFKRLPNVAMSLGIGLLFVSSLLSANAQEKDYPDTVWVPVTFYDYHPDTSFGFEQCMTSTPNAKTPDMVQNTIELPNRKPLRNASACNTSNLATYPCACALNDWFRPTGYSTTTNLKFEPVQTVYKNDTIYAHRWSGLQRNTSYSTASDTFWTLPNWDSTVSGANLVYYSYLPFVLTDRALGTYEFDRTGGNNQFFWLDNKGFGNEPSNQNPKHNFGFTMELHQEFTYQGDKSQSFSFSGDDDVWVFINDKLVMDLGGIHGEIGDNFNLFDEAERLGLIPGRKYWLDVFYTERHTILSNCQITSNLLRPSVDKLLIAECDNLCPGDTIVISGKIFDKDSTRMQWLEDSISWEIISPTVLHVNDKLIDIKGRETRFTATQAWRNISVRAWVSDPYTPEMIKSDTVTFSIDVCTPDHIVIEGDTNPDFNKEQPLDSISINSNENVNDKIYAVIRDKFGNLSDTIKKFTSQTATTWTSADTRIATIKGETGKTYHGIASRADTAGSVIVTASDGNLKPGTLKVIISDYYIDSLRLRDVKTGEIVDMILIETDSTGEYTIEGLRSNAVDKPNDPSSWVVVNAKIGLKDTLISDCKIPEFDSKWTFCPHNHGKGKVILTNPQDTSTKTTIIPVTVILSRPRMGIQILTPENKRIAGDTLQVRVYIENDDGLIPIPYCFGGEDADIKDSIAYFDNLGRGGAARPEPFSLVNDSKLPLNFDFEKYHTKQCFKDGADTFGVVLYYAPFQAGTDSMHILSLLAGTRQAQTAPFKLIPGPLYKIKFEDNGYVEYQGPITLNPVDGIFSTFATGYDKYGNRIGHQPSDWSVTGTLDPEKMGPKTGEKNWYQAKNELDALTGKLVAQAKGINDSMIVGSIDIIVSPPKSNVTSAITRDINGNGRLDRIDITFHKKTEFKKDGGDISIVNLNPSTNLTDKDKKSIDSIVPIGTSGKEFSIYFAEKQVFGNGKDKKIELPQTGWTPKLTLSGFSEVADTTVTVEDGAAPVVWKAHKQIVSAIDTKKDIISITLSEKISKGGGSNLVTVESDPTIVLKIWEKVKGDFVYQDILKGIENFDNIKDSANVSILIFKMTNGQDISDKNWVNIFYDNRLVADEKSNYTHELNQKVKFDVDGNVIIFDVIPSPGRATTNLTNPGEIVLYHSKTEAFKKLKDADGGFIFKFTVTRPSDTTKYTMDIKIKVYDVIGNQVASLPVQKNILSSEVDNSDSSNVIDFLYGWGGTNEKGMKAAPGTYKAIAWVNFNTSRIKDVKCSRMFGIKK